MKTALALLLLSSVCLAQDSPTERMLRMENEMLRAMLSRKGGDPVVVSPGPVGGTTPVPPPADLRPVLPMYVPSDGSCPLCNRFKALPEDVKAGLPFRIEARVNDEIAGRLTSEGEQYGWPVFHTPLSPDGQSYYLFHVDNVDELTRRWEAVMSADDAAAAPTPHDEIDRILAQAPEPRKAFVDYGCGDARWLIAAVRKWGCRAVGVEIDTVRAQDARRRVREAGLEDRIEIIEGDALTVDVDADVGVAYLYPETLKALRQKLERLDWFASYMHSVPGLSMVKRGDTWVWSKPAPIVQQSQPYAVWNGQIYYSANGNCNCEMCRSIRYQLAH